MGIRLRRASGLRTSPSNYNWRPCSGDDHIKTAMVRVEFWLGVYCAIVSIIVISERDPNLFRTLKPKP